MLNIIKERDSDDDDDNSFSIKNNMSNKTIKRKVKIKA